MTKEAWGQNTEAVGRGPVGSGSGVWNSLLEMQRPARASQTLLCSPQKSKHTESDKLSVQIQAYLDNVFDVGGLLEDAETKNVALEKVEELEDHLSHVRTALPIITQHELKSQTQSQLYCQFFYMY